MKTLLEIKNHVAQLEGYADWCAIDNSELSEMERNELKVSLMDEIAKLYAKTACEEQRVICQQHVTRTIDYSEQCGWVIPIGVKSMRDDNQLIDTGYCNDVELKNQ